MSKEMETSIDMSIYEECIGILDRENYANKAYYNVMVKWMKNRNQDKYIGEYLTYRGISTIAVYGAGNLGELLVEEIIKNSGIQVKYIIDRSSLKKDIKSIPILSLGEVKEKQIDCIIITPIHAYESIKRDIESRQVFNMSSIVGIDKIVFDIADGLEEDGEESV